jgi:hypothetical protein
MVHHLHHHKGNIEDIQENIGEYHHQIIEFQNIEEWDQHEMLEEVHHNK